MKTLNIADLIGTPNAIIQKFGLQVYQAVSALVVTGETIVLDLTGLVNATTAFFHASVGNLYRDMGDQFFRQINIKGLDKNPLWQDKYDEAIEFAKDPSKARQVDTCISDLFA